MSKQEIWNDNYGDCVVVEIFPVIPGSVEPVVGFNTFDEAKEQYPKANIDKNKTFSWEDYDG